MSSTSIPKHSETKLKLNFDYFRTSVVSLLFSREAPRPKRASFTDKRLHSRNGAKDCLNGAPAPSRCGTYRSRTDPTIKPHAALVRFFFGCFGSSPPPPLFERLVPLGFSACPFGAALEARFVFEL